MAFRLTNAHAAFMEHLDNFVVVFIDDILVHWDSFVVVFIDETLVYSSTEEAHHEQLGIVLRTLKEYKLYAKLNKCEFWMKELNFSGNVVSGE